MKVVIIGAGVGGLATAALLAAQGHHVVVCEQAETVGGKVGLIERDGFRFDTGPSLLTMPHVLDEVFAACGASLADHLDVVRVEPIARTRFADGTTIETLSDLDAFCAQLDERLEPGSGDDWRRLMDRAAAIWRTVEVPVLRSPLRGLRDLAPLAGRASDLARVAPQQTLRALGRRHLRDARLRMFLERYATYTGSDPRRAPAALLTIPYVEQTFGGWYVRGGLRRIGEALRDLATSCGAVVRTGADVTQIELRSGRACGVRLAGGERIAADVVVANADATHVYGDLVPVRATRSARRRLARAEPSLSGFVLLLGVEGKTPGVPHHSVLFPADYDAEFDQVFSARPRPVDDPTIYVAVPDDRAVAPHGCEAWFVLVNAPRHGHGGVDWASPQRAQSYGEHILDALAARGLDLRGRVRARETITPADLEQRTRAVGGAIYGTSSNGRRAAFLRPANATPVPGLYLVGGSSHPGGGLPLVLLSAQIVAELVTAPGSFARRRRAGRSR